MHTHTLSLLEHEHDFSVINKKGERRTKLVLVLTFLTMTLEIIAGTLFGSMALLADAALGPQGLAQLARALGPEFRDLDTGRSRNHLQGAACFQRSGRARGVDGVCLFSVAQREGKRTHGLAFGRETAGHGPCSAEPAYLRGQYDQADGGRLVLDVPGRSIDGGTTERGHTGFRCSLETPGRQSSQVRGE